MSTKSVDMEAWKVHPFTYRNNRGTAFTKQGQFISFGIPEPRKGELMRGGDRIGFDVVEITPDMIGSKVAIFTSIEIKGYGDHIRAGQDKWHNFVLDNGGHSEIWKEKKDGSIEVISDKIEEKNEKEN